MRPRFQAIASNRLTLLGSVVALISLSVILVLIGIDATSKQPSPYLGIVTFVLLPVFLNVGILAAVWGMIRTYRRLQAGKADEPVSFKVDFALPRHRRTILVLLFSTTAFLGLSSFGAYKAYEFTETVEFCGTVCHNVMKPEYVAYKSSPHARVACVQCHIGSGTTWFIKSKISGSYQVYSVLFNKYHRPIETPVANLRPARETCEECHWPKQFYSAKLQPHSYFGTDDKSTPSRLDMLVKIGGGNPSHGAAEGIHYHMFLNAQISYVATDRQRNTIPYVEVKYPDGRLDVFQSTDAPMPADQVARSEKHIVDCIECHNRPTHIYHHPAQSVNLAMAQGWISATLPEVKRLTVEVLQKEYKTEDEAVRGIRSGIEEFYKTKYSQVAATRAKDIDAAIVQTQEIYKRNFFPEMKVSWKGFPDHIGHMYSPGCFRCHDGKHQNSQGKVLSRDCNVCHTIVSQTGADGKTKADMKGVPFQHPTDIGTAWADMNCSECHASQ